MENTLNNNVLGADVQREGAPKAGGPKAGALRADALKQNFAALVSGLIFAIGLGLSGMTKPDKVMGFLDFFGEWDPSLALVMGAAVAVHALIFRIVLKQKQPLFGGRFSIPTRTDIDVRLVAGAAIFGAGWGLGGFCPGPALTSLPTGSLSALIFVGAMFLGMAAFKAWEEFRASKPA